MESYNVNDNNAVAEFVGRLQKEKALLFELVSASRITEQQYREMLEPIEDRIRALLTGSALPGLIVGGKRAGRTFSMDASQFQPIRLDPRLWSDPTMLYLSVDYARQEDGTIMRLLTADELKKSTQPPMSADEFKKKYLAEWETRLRSEDPQPLPWRGRVYVQGSADWAAVEDTANDAVIDAIRRNRTPADIVWEESDGDLLCECDNVDCSVRLNIDYEQYHDLSAWSYRITHESCSYGVLHARLIARAGPLRVWSKEV